MKKLLLIFIFSIFLFSCYIVAEEENGDIAVNIPFGSLYSKSISYGDAGFEVYIIGSTIADYENISSGDEMVFYYRDIIVPENIFNDPYFISEDESYELILDNVPEGDNLYMIIKYVSNDYIDYVEPPDPGTIGYFMTIEPFSVRNNETTYIQLTALSMYNEESHW